MNEIYDIIYKKITFIRKNSFTTYIFIVKRSSKLLSAHLKPNLNMFHYERCIQIE